MRYGVLTLFPEMFSAITTSGVIGRAFKQHKWQLSLYDLRLYAEDKAQTVDDRPFGGGPGMVLKAEILQRAYQEALKDYQDATFIYVSPQGEPLTHELSLELSREPALLFLAGRYEGVDERFITATKPREISLGDYVISGGELAIMVLIDSILRQQPGILGDLDSASNDSFALGLLDAPHYTRPNSWQGQAVPPVLLSGNHQSIARWRLKMSLGRTWQRRPDLLAKRMLTKVEQQLLAEFKVESEGGVYE